MPPSAYSATKFGTELRRLRTSAGLSQEALAERAGLSVRGISDLERGARTQPRLETVRMIAGALELSEDERQVLLSASRPAQSFQSETSKSAPPGHTLRFPSLHQPPTRMVGRDNELKRILDWFQSNQTRLVTLTGQGGIGKTRLALAAAHQLAEMRCPAALIDLSPISDPAMVPTVVATHLDVRPDAEETSLQATANRIADTRCVLVLDNWEQVITGATYVSDLLAICPKLMILATSRERLHLRGERELRLQPLSLPETEGVNFGTEAVPDAVQLFVERIQDTEPEFDVTPSNQALLIDICRRLEGLPLALEIAAARMSVLSLEELRDQLESRLRTITDGPRDLPDRQQTMERTIAWSFDLLNSQEQEVLLGISIFSGGFDQQQALSVSAPVEVDADSFAAILRSLVAKSLVQISRRSGRFSIAETVREFGLSRLDQHDRIELFANRHATRFVEEASLADELLKSSEPMEEFHRLEDNIDNIRWALRWLLQSERVAEAAMLATGLAWFWTEPRYLEEGRSWFQRILAHQLLLEPRLRATTLMSAGDLAQWQLDVETAAQLQAAALQIWRELGDDAQVAAGLRGSASAAMERGDYAIADELLSESKLIAQVAQHQWELAAATNLLGLSGSFQGDFDRAIALHLEALHVWLELEDESHIAAARGSLAWAYLQSSQFDQSAAEFLESLELAQSSEDQLLTLWSVTGAACLAFFKNQDPETASQLLAYADSVRGELGTPLWAPMRKAIAELQLRLQQALSESRYLALVQTGQNLTQDAALEQSIAILTAQSPA